MCMQMIMMIPVYEKYIVYICCDYHSIYQGTHDVDFHVSTIFMPKYHHLMSLTCQNVPGSLAFLIIWEVEDRNETTMLSTMQALSKSYKIFSSPFWKDCYLVTIVISFFLFQWQTQRKFQAPLSEHYSHLHSLFLIFYKLLLVCCSSKHDCSL